jgi:hypothetical protein
LAIPVSQEVWEVVAATSAFFGAVGVGLKKAGLLTLGRPTERRQCSTEIGKVCIDHKSMKADIEVIKQNSDARLRKLEKVEGTVNDVKSGVDRIIGYLQGKNGFHV